MTTHPLGGARPGAGRKPIERLTLQINLGKATPSGNLNTLTMTDLHSKRRQRQDALKLRISARKCLPILGLTAISN